MQQKTIVGREVLRAVALGSFGYAVWALVSFSIRQVERKRRHADELGDGSNNLRRICEEVLTTQHEVQRPCTLEHVGKQLDVKTPTYGVIRNIFQLLCFRTALKVVTKLNDVLLHFPRLRPTFQGAVFISNLECRIVAAEDDRRA